MNFKDLFSINNFFYAWYKYRRGKTKKFSTFCFERNLEENIFSIFEEFESNSYKHGDYKRFFVWDIKKREINTASVKDKIVHQIVYDYLVKLYEPIFIYDSFSSRVGKGVLKAVDKLKFFLKDEFAWNFGKCFAIKGDVKKFFDNIDHNILIDLLQKKVKDENIMNVIEKIIRSFEIKGGKGIPLGNITSQIFANIYLNEFDLFIKKELKIRKYVRYNDDFVLLGENTETLKEIASKIKLFLNNKLLLELPKEKISIRKFNWGINFLGKILLPNVVILRKKTKNKIKKRFSEENKSSYFGLLSQTNSFKFKRCLIAKLKDDC